MDGLIRLEADKPDAIEKWARWRTIEGRPEQLQRTRARIQKMHMWPSWSEEQKRQILEILLSPFVAAPDTIDELMKQA